MARAQRAWTESYEAPSYFAAYGSSPAYSQAGAGQQQPDEKQRVRRTRQRPQPNTETRTRTKGQVLTVSELRQMIGVAIFVALLLIGTLVLNAYAASIQCSINELTRDNLELEDEIDALHMKIDSSTSIEQIESYAMKELNMRYPKSEQCIYVEEDAVLMENFSQVLRQKAYE